MTGPEEILKFWLDDAGPEKWYAVDDAFDQEIRDRFLTTWEAACEGKFSLWLTYPAGALAYLILTDQFPRNMFRGQGRAFSSDRAALAAAKSSIHKGWDLRIDPPARQFFYLPLMHSENLMDQDRCVRLICERMPAGSGTMIHARAHRQVIRDFGRFPYRNEALDRHSTADEMSYIKAGGYGSTMRDLQDKAA
ncbi:Uncharacterized conserved protein, DUF924 family [Sulfitobacter marinus]|uniref:Uncharacterized conserved protein, DUF924 family n=1 Tax=Sulfitobacter marinus TaxID=394264 RepID=A0A1I6Q778_9RHOB|nr:DUF924 family protein [Sulfitobacter marinus]SFS48282.1 Uncharacterized conserved protein, DUF924 family [Sulfitobacter marinus]